MKTKGIHMHPRIDDRAVERIRSTGNGLENLPDRKTVLEEKGLPYDRRAQNVVISGCQILSFLPHVVSSLARIYDRKGFSYTFLSKEYCCGSNLYRPAIKARDEEAMAACRDLSKEFVARNLEAAKGLGAKRLVIFCSPCYPIFKHAFPQEDIVFYPVTLAEVMGRISFEEDIDYYAGCYRLHRKFSPVPMDLKSTEAVFTKLEGVKINRIPAPECCYKPEGTAHMIGSIKTRMMVHICTGCYGQASGSLSRDSGTEVMMLPEVVERAMGRQG
jgi:Cysteine-rich domain